MARLTYWTGDKRRACGRMEGSSLTTCFAAASVLTATTLSRAAAKSAFCVASTCMGIAAWITPSGASDRYLPDE